LSSISRKAREFSINDGDPENEAVCEVEQRLAGRPDPAIDSHFEYGSRAGWWRDHGGARSAPRTGDGEFERPRRRALPLLAQDAVRRGHEVSAHAGDGKGMPVWMRQRNATVLRAP
jgi:hypothetical protein